MLALAVPAAAIAAGAPRVTTEAATALSSTGATLNGTVNPNGNATTYYFEYGPTKTYGTKTAVVNAGSGNAKSPASAPVSGLTASTTYHFRLVATNSAGTTNWQGQGVHHARPGPDGHRAEHRRAAQPAGVGRGHDDLRPAHGRAPDRGRRRHAAAEPLSLHGRLQGARDGEDRRTGPLRVHAQAEGNTRYEVQARRPGPT